MIGIERGREGGREGLPPPRFANHAPAQRSQNP
jgi:hypothetical protein